MSIISSIFLSSFVIQWSYLCFSELVVDVLTLLVLVVVAHFVKKVVYSSLVVSIGRFASNSLPIVRTPKDGRYRPHANTLIPKTRKWRHAMVTSSVRFRITQRLPYPPCRRLTRWWVLVKSLLSIYVNSPSFFSLPLALRRSEPICRNIRERFPSLPRFWWTSHVNVSKLQIIVNNYIILCV